MFEAPVKEKWEASSVEEHATRGGQLLSPIQLL
jgi:hypothetical protein